MDSGKGFSNIIGKRILLLVQRGVDEVVVRWSISWQSII